jgi:transcriptional regulator with XRE-family HTH domain
MPKTSAKSPAASDRIIGRNVRLQRLARGMSQTALARTLGVAYQQVQRYERGINRIGSGRLTRIAEGLEVPLAVLFEGTEPGQQRHAASLTHLLADRQSLRLVKAFARVKDVDARKLIIALVEAMASGLRRRAEGACDARKFSRRRKPRLDPDRRSVSG